MALKVYMKSLRKLALEKHFFFIFCSQMVNIIVLVKNRKNELLLLPVPGSIPQNQNNFFELSVKNTSSGTRLLYIAVRSLYRNSQKTNVKSSPDV